LTLGISNFPPGDNPHDADNNYIIPVLLRVYSSAGGCDSRHQEFLMWLGSAWSAQLTALVQRQGKCQVVPIQCTPASYSCSASNSTRLAGSGIARRGGLLYHHTHYMKFYLIHQNICFLAIKIYGNSDVKYKMKVWRGPIQC